MPMPRRLVSAFAFALSVATPAHGSAVLDDWRNSVEQTRILADNDAVLANREAERLVKLIPGDATPSDRARILNVLTRTEIYLALTDKAARHAERAFELAREHDDKIGQAEADLNISLNAVNQGDLQAHFRATTHSMTVLEGVDRPDLLSEAMLRTAMMYRRIGEFDGSVTLPLQALEIAEGSGSPLAQAYAHEGMAVSLQQNGHPAEALDHFVQMREHARDANSKILELQATLDIGSALTDQGKLAEGEAEVRRAIAGMRAFGGPFYLVHALYQLSSTLKRQGKSLAALAVLDEAASIYERYENRIGLWWVLRTRSTDLQALGRLAEAQADADRAYALAKDIGLTLYLSQSQRQLASIAAARGDFEHAYNRSRDAMELADKAVQEHSSTRMQELAQRFRSESKQREIEDLKRRNERQTVWQYWLWTVLGGSVAILAGTAYFLMRLRRSHRLVEAANSRLRESQREVETLNVGLEQRVQARTAELRQQARYLRTLIDMLPMWTWFKDVHSRYLVSNQAHASACGHAAEDMVGKSDFDVVPQAVAESRLADDFLVMASQERRSTEENLPDGQASRWMETYKAAVVDEDGTILGTVGFARDISERKAAEEARNAALAEAERLARLRIDFLAQMSHELRTPLNGILGYAQILARDAALEGRDAAGLAVIMESGEQLLELVNDILDLAKIEAGKLDVQPSTVALRPLLRSIANVFAMRAEQKGLAFSCETAPSLPKAIQVDERLLRQVLLNLLANAVRFTNAGGIILRVGRVGASRIRFAVEDTGIGIPPERIESIFNPFEQAGTTRQRMGGSGLGLAISRKFLSRMDSEIFVASTPGKGSTFWFELHAPDAADDRESSIAPGIVCGYEGPRRIVLVADEADDSRRLLVDMLEPLGFRVVPCGAAQEAGRAAQEHVPDLILLDAALTADDGMSAIQMLRRLPALARTRILALSADIAVAVRRQAFADGASDFLPKPIRLDALLDRIAALLGLALIRQADSLPETVRPDSDSLLAPPHEHMKILLQLALQGNMRDILRYCDALLVLDRRYHPFAEHLRQLAASYRSKAILELVERHMDGSHGE